MTVTATDTATRHGQESAPAIAAGPLPPYSGADAVCAKCLYGEASTRYRPATHRLTAADWNGSITVRGPLPERHERECDRCSYTWDEALVTDTDGMTVDALAHALHNALPYPVELDRPVREDTARELLAMLRITARPEHALWQYSDGRPPPLAICEEPHPTREDEDACERRRAPKEATP